MLRYVITTYEIKLSFSNLHTKKWLLFCTNTHFCKMTPENEFLQRVTFCKGCVCSLIECANLKLEFEQKCLTGPFTKAFLKIFVISKAVECLPKCHV